MNIWKRNAIVAVVVLFVCVAVYLNWSMNQVTPVDSAYEEFETEKTLAEAAKTEDGQTNDSTVSAENQEDMSSVQTSLQPDASASPEASSYFSEARLSRQQARDSALAVLEEATTSDASVEDTMAQEVSAIAQNALQEVRIESLIKAKGYADCVAFINEDSINIVVSAPEEGLNQTDVAKIQDIVQNETGFTSEQITIVEVAGS